MTALWMALILAFVNIPQIGSLTALEVHAEEYTVSGKVDSRSSSSMLYLTNGEGTYIIKIDSSTAIAGAISSGKTVKTTFSRGNDGYLHATKINADGSTTTTQQTAQSSANGVTLNTANAVSVVGEVGKDSTDSVLRLVYKDGTMLVKIDSTTSLGNIRVLTQGRKIQVKVAHGSDGYMHALSISDVIPGSEQNTQAVVNDYGISGAVTTGTITDGTTSDLLCVSNGDGVYKLKIDSSSDFSACRAMVKGRKVTVGFVWKNDGYNHVTKAVGVTESRSSATIDKSSEFTVQGKVGADTTENELFLINGEGTYKMKIDASTVMGSCKSMYYNQQISVTAARGSDGYIHVLRVDLPRQISTIVNGQTVYSYTVQKTGDSVTVKGTVVSGTSDSMLYLASNGGTMSIKLDQGTDLSSCKALMENETVTATVYPGSDAYYHASTLINEHLPGSASVTNADTTVTGTVNGETTGSTLVLDTNGGKMQIKLDTGTQMGNCKVLTKGAKVKVGVGRANDDYWHAVSMNKE